MAVSEHWDTGAKADLLADDYLQIDHRPLGFGTMTRDDVLAATDSVEEVGGVPIAPQIFRIGPHGTVASFRLVHADDTGDWLESFPSIFVSYTRDGKLHAHEIFADDQLDAALDCFGHLEDR